MNNVLFAAAWFATTRDLRRFVKRAARNLLGNRDFRHKRERSVAVATLIFAVFATIASSSATAEVRAWVDAQTVDEMETVRLTLRADGVGNQVDAQPDLSELETDFEVLGTNTSSQFQIINGQTQSWIEYQINLRPKRTGTLTIPPIAIVGERSQPLQISVRPLPPEVRQAIDRLVFFEVDVTPNPVYVQAQALMTRRLYYSGGVQIYSDLPGAPDIPNAVVLPVGDTRSTTETRPEGRYGVLEQRYAIFPEKSGALTIPEISVTSSVRLQSGGRTRRTGLRVSSPEVRLEVLPVPAAYPADQPWLPARQVSISDVWEPASLSFEAGKPVRRTLTVNATGNTGSAIPPLAMRLPEGTFKEYPEPVAISEEAVSMDVVGTRQQPYSIVPVSPGAAQLPRIQLTWWDTVNNRVRVATVASEPVRVAGDPGTPQRDSTSVSPLVGDLAVTENPTANDNRSPANTSSTTAEPLADDGSAIEPGAVSAANRHLGTSPASYPIWLVALTVFAFCGWATTWLTMRRGRAKPAARQPDSQAEKSLRNLANACRHNDAKAIRDAWIRHLGACWKTPPDQTVARLRQHPEGGRLLDTLNRSLYSPAPTTAPNGRAILEFSRSLPKPANAKKAQPLPALHPH